MLSAVSMVELYETEPPNPLPKEGRGSRFDPPPNPLPAGRGSKGREGSECPGCSASATELPLPAGRGLGGGSNSLLTKAVAVAFASCPLSYPRAPTSPERTQGGRPVRGRSADCRR